MRVFRAPARIGAPRSLAAQRRLARDDNLQAPSCDPENQTAPLPRGWLRDSRPEARLRAQLGLAIARPIHFQQALFALPDNECATCDTGTKALAAVISSGSGPVWSLAASQAAARCCARGMRPVVARELRARTQSNSR